MVHFEFLTETPASASANIKSHQRRRAVRSHAARISHRKAVKPTLRSWMSSQPVDSTLFSSHAHRSPRKPPSPPETAILRPVGTELSWMPFSEDMAPYMLEDVRNFFKHVMSAAYPSELCSAPDFSAEWAGSVVADRLILHAIIFATEAYHGSELRVALHLQRTLQLLRETLCSPSLNDCGGDGGGYGSGVSDAVLIAVVLLAQMSFYLSDRAGIEVHMKGVYQLVGLRGGVGKLPAELREKMCRVDLSYSIRYGPTPIFFRESISWNPYNSNSTLKSRRRPSPSSLVPGAPTLSQLLPSLDARLIHVWDDMRHFCHQSEVGIQTGRKFSREAYAEIMTSILYRLLHYPLGDDSVVRALHAGMRLWAVSLYFRWQCERGAADMFGEPLNAVLTSLEECRSDDVPDVLVFWLVMLWKAVVSEGEAWKRHESLLIRTAGKLGLKTWANAEAKLRLMVWLSSIHGRQARALFEGILITGSLNQE